MSRKGPTKNEYSQGLTYVANTPAFLKNFGKPRSPSPDRSGRAPLPERPREGKWARGSDDEGGGGEEEEDDEWGQTYGGGGRGEEGPQVVVLKEGRHLTAEDLKRERRRGGLCAAYDDGAGLTILVAAGKPSTSPSPPSARDRSPPSTTAVDPFVPTKPKTQLPKISSSAKRKLVGGATEGKEGKDETPPGNTKRKKKGKGMLSFNEAEGEI